MRALQIRCSQHLTKDPDNAVLLLMFYSSPRAHSRCVAYTRKNNTLEGLRKPQLRTGHASISTTAQYLQFGLEERQETEGVFGKWLRAALAAISQKQTQKPHGRKGQEANI
jgi:hypothetical protein